MFKREFINEERAKSAFRRFQVFGIDQNKGEKFFRSHLSKKEIDSFLWEEFGKMGITTNDKDKFEEEIVAIGRYIIQIEWGGEFLSSYNEMDLEENEFDFIDHKAYCSQYLGEDLEEDKEEFKLKIIIEEFYNNFISFIKG